MHLIISRLPIRMSSCIYQSLLHGGHFYKGIPLIECIRIKDSIPFIVLVCSYTSELCYYIHLMRTMTEIREMCLMLQADLYHKILYGCKTLFILQN